MDVNFVRVVVRGHDPDEIEIFLVNCSDLAFFAATRKQEVLVKKCSENHTFVKKCNGTHSATCHKCTFIIIFSRGSYVVGGCACKSSCILNSIS